MIRKYASQYCMQKESKEVVRRVRSKNWGQFLPLFKAATVAHGLQVRRWCMSHLRCSYIFVIFSSSFHVSMDISSLSLSAVGTFRSIPKANASWNFNLFRWYKWKGPKKTCTQTDRLISCDQEQGSRIEHDYHRVAMYRIPLLILLSVIEGWHRFISYCNWVWLPESVVFFYGFSVSLRIFPFSLPVSCT